MSLGTARVLKWSVPVDDSRAHPIGSGPVLHVACQTSPDSVEVWTLEDPPTAWRPVRVYGTGQSIPFGWSHIGSAVTAEGALVWHVFEAPNADG